MGIGRWTDCKDEMPPMMLVVIGEYKGFWPQRGNGGITDLYAYKGSWFNIPDNVEITRWMYIPDWELEEALDTPWTDTEQYRRI